VLLEGMSGRADNNPMLQTIQTKVISLVSTVVLSAQSYCQSWHLNSSTQSTLEFAAECKTSGLR